MSCLRSFAQVPPSKHLLLHVGSGQRLASPLYVRRLLKLLCALRHVSALRTIIIALVAASYKGVARHYITATGITTLCLAFA